MMQFKNLAEKNLTAHQLAKLLLQMPDEPVMCMGWGNYINNIEEAKIFGPKEKKIISLSFDKIEEEEENTFEEEKEWISDSEKKEFMEDWINEISSEDNRVILEKNGDFYVASHRKNEWEDPIVNEGKTKASCLIGLFKKLYHVIDKTEKYYDGLLKMYKNSLKRGNGSEFDEAVEELLKMEFMSQEFKEQIEVIIEIVKKSMLDSF